jgi:maltose alpha-D-glucosyltransferase / alpha-amylase
MSDDPLWYKDAIIYQMHVKAFQDANGDGIGDFAGLAQKLDYIQELGVNTIWLLPFYPSPMRDDGYDIADYTNVHPDYGTLDDFRQFIDEAHLRGLKVITELVINHTSDQHPWFQAARLAAPGSREREFYVWSDDDQKFAGTRIIFTDTEASNWDWDPVARQYYWHRFFSHQPDLNHNNPEVVDAVIQVMRFWMDMGVDGMRLDAIPYLCVREGTNNENLPETHAVLKRMRAAMDEHYTGRMFLAEANQWPEDVREYFGEGDECHMAYNFPLMPRIFMSVALEDRYPIAEIIRQTPDIPDNCQWAIFLRNHDELTLEMVTDRERDYMYKMYANEPRMRVNVGIRRRLATLLGNDVDRIKLMNSLLLSMPGSPIIYYGDEIGMGDNIYIGDRNGVRTPMQWSIDRNAGFSRADPQRLYLPVIMDPIYGYQAVNVEAQSRDPSSLLNWTRRMLSVRRQFQCFGRGSLEFIRPQNRKIIAYVRSCGSEMILCVANLSQTAQAVELDLSRFKGRVPVEMLGRNTFPPIGELPYFLTLPAHGFFWLQLSESAPPPSWHVERLPATELPVLVLSEGLATFLPEMTKSTNGGLMRRTLQHLESEVLPEFISARGWFPQHRSEISSVHLGPRTLWRYEQRSYLISFVDIIGTAGRRRYIMPLTVGWEDGADTLLKTAEWTLAKVREHARAGVMVDAFADPIFCLGLIQFMADRASIPFAGAELRFESRGPLPVLPEADLQNVRQVGTEPTNTNIVIDESLFLKAYRSAEPGVNPDLEMSRLLTGAGFTGVAPMLGHITWDDTTPTLLVSLFAYVRNQGDMWNYTLNHLDRHVSSISSQDASVPEAPHALFTTQVQTLGQRIGEMHSILAKSNEVAFAPEPIRSQDLSRWYTAVQLDTEAVLNALNQRLPGLSENVRARAEQLVAARERLIALIRDLTAAPIDGLRIRVHGNLHLAKVMLAADDFVLTGFEGDTTLPLEERRQKDSPLHDVASVLVSFHYARSVASDNAIAHRPELRERAEPELDQWQLLTNRAFLQGYRRAVAESGILPSTEPSMQRLLKLFMLIRAVRALRNELERRPQMLPAAIDALYAQLSASFE